MTPKTGSKGDIASGAQLAHPQPDLPQDCLPQLCDRAADHLARARIALFDDAQGADRALLHLDEAIGCLKRLWGGKWQGGKWQGGKLERSKARQSASPAKAPVHPAQRRSA